MTTLRRDLMNSASHKALWEKVRNGSKLISGRHWQMTSGYEHYWELVRRLYAMAYGATRSLPNSLKEALNHMLGAHAGRIRKGIRGRPYFHHILLVVYFTWVFDLPIEVQLAAICHDDREDLPKHLQTTLEWVDAVLDKLIGSQALAMVIHLTNDPHWPDKHLGQQAKMARLSALEALLKILDRCANMFDMRYDKPTDMTPADVAGECRKAVDLAAAAKELLPEEALALLTFCVDMLEREHNLEPLAA